MVKKLAHPAKTSYYMNLTGAMYRVHSSRTNHIRFSVSAANHMKIEILINKHIITMYCSFYENQIFDSTDVFCGTDLFFNTLILNA